MRALILTIIVFGSLPYILRRPYIGVLMWAWLSYMNPHKLAFGFAPSFAYAQLVAVVTLISVLLNKEKLSFPITALTLTWFVFIVWMTITTLFGLLPEAALDQYIKVMKIQLVTLLTVMIMTTRERINLLLGVIALSIAFFGIKGGIFTLAQGGGNRVWGPPATFIEENNALAVALLMVMPLLYYLSTQAPNVWLKRGLLASVLLSGLAALGTYSRGAIIAAAMVILFFLAKSKRKLATALALIVLIPPALVFMPEKWHERINTMFQSNALSKEDWSIETGLPPPIEVRDRLGFWPNDNSAAGRVNAWNYAVNVANSRITGGGMESWSEKTFALYAPIPEDWHSSHSIYFGMLADHGWIGLGMFLAIGLMTWVGASRTIKQCADVEELKWLADLSRMIQVGLVAYGTGGAFLSLAYFDLPWHLMSIVIISRNMVHKHFETQTLSAVPERSFGGRRMAMSEARSSRSGSY